MSGEQEDHDAAAAGIEARFREVRAADETREIADALDDRTIGLECAALERAGEYAEAASACRAPDGAPAAEYARAQAVRRLLDAAEAAYGDGRGEAAGSPGEMRQ